jgi:hypothetical protein
MKKMETMRVFISWSGPRSRKVAEFLSGWLRKLPLPIEPWISKEAIDPGTRWDKELAEALKETRFGILCLTPENQLEPWICFEAGALAKTIEKTHVIPYLIDMKPEDLKQPLKQFQATQSTEEDTWKMVKTIYKASGDETRSESDLKEVFEMWWPKLQEQIEEAKKEAYKTVTEEPLELSDIMNGIGNIMLLLESLSSRLTKWESHIQILPPLSSLAPPPLRLSDVLKMEEPKGKTLYEVLLEVIEQEHGKSKPINYLLEMIRKEPKKEE